MESLTMQRSEWINNETSGVPWPSLCVNDCVISLYNWNLGPWKNCGILFIAVGFIQRYPLFRGLTGNHHHHHHLLLLLLLHCCRRFRLFYSGIKSLHLLFGRPEDPIPAEIWINFSASIVVICSSHSLLLLSIQNNKCKIIKN